MTHRFDQNLMEHLAHLEQIQERLRQKHQELRAQLAQVTQEQRALKRQWQLIQRRIELKRLRKELLNEVLSVMDAQLEMEEQLTETARFLAQMEE
jgi:chromosome segregation ATPase